MTSYAVCILHIVIVTTYRESSENNRTVHGVSTPVVKKAKQSLEISINKNNNQLIVKTVKNN